MSKKRPARRRESIMQRRLRKARGEDIADELEDDDDYDDDDNDDDDDFRPSRKMRPEDFPYPYPYDYRLYERGGSGCFSGILYTLLGGMIVLFLVLFFEPVFSGVGAFFSNFKPAIPTLIKSPTPTINRSALVIQEMRQLSRIETTSYSIQTVIEAGIEGNVFEELLFGDRILLIAHGTIVAGMDLETLHPDDVVVSEDGQQVRIQAPPPQIFNVFLDNEKTRVYDRQQGWLASPDKDLETHARQQAEQEVLLAACEGGIMQRATADGRRTLEQLLQMLDFERVEVVAAPIPACPPPTPGPPTVVP